MKLSIVLSLICLAFTVFGAPTKSPKAANKPDSSAKQENGLEAELEGAGNRDSEDRNIVSSQDRIPEVKRSERVSTDEDDFTGLSGTMELADQDVRDVLKAFFQGLKEHPEVVADILGKEGEKILQQSADSLPAEENTDITDSTIFQNPSPQLIQSPKQVEKKTGEFPAYPRFIYKSPMRNAAERDQMTSTANKGKPEQRSGSKDVDLDDTFKVDISNAIPVIQQPSTMHKTDESVNIVPDELEEGGVEDVDSLHEEQDQLRQQQPFINPLPIFPQPGGQAPVDAADSESRTDDAQPIDPEPRAESNTLSKKSKPEHDKESSSESSEEDSSEVADNPHYLTGQQIAAEDLAHPVAQESSVPFYYYYYDEHNDGQGAGEQDTDAEEDESQLANLNSQSYTEDEYNGDLEEYDPEDEEESNGSDSQENEEDEEETDDEDPESKESSDGTEEESNDDGDDDDDESDEKDESDDNRVETNLKQAPQTQSQQLQSPEAALMSLAENTPNQRGRVVGAAM